MVRNVVTPIPHEYVLVDDDWTRVYQCVRCRITTQVLQSCQIWYSVKGERLKIEPECNG